MVPPVVSGVPGISARAGGRPQVKAENGEHVTSDFSTLQLIKLDISPQYQHHHSQLLMNDRRTDTEIGWSELIHIWKYSGHIFHVPFWGESVPFCEDFKDSHKKCCFKSYFPQCLWYRHKIFTLNVIYVPCIFMAFYPETAEVNICRKNKNIDFQFPLSYFSFAGKFHKLLTLTEYQGSFSIEMNYGQL